jgi:exopolysaccharide biosynthesis WecB/TagA/CpsF family protein
MSSTVASASDFRQSGFALSPSAPDTIDVFGMPFENVSLKRAVDTLITAARRALPARVVFVNAHVINEAAKDGQYLDTVATADIRYADGSGMAIAAKLAGRAFVDNVNGTDMFPVLCEEAARAGVSIFLLGAKPGVAAAVEDKVAKTELGRAIAGSHHGYISPGSADEEAAIAAINASGAGILLVAMGVPVQDQWIERNRSRIKTPVMIGVGGLFDFASGQMPRAPKMFRRLGCEWIWRLAMEPRRMWRRYLIGNVVFMGHAATAAWREAHDQRAIGQAAKTA